MLDIVLLVTGVVIAVLAAVSRGLNRAVVLTALSMLVLAAAYGYAGLKFLAVAQVMAAGGTVVLFNLVSSSFRDNDGDRGRLAAVIPAVALAFSLAAVFGSLYGEVPSYSSADVPGSGEALGLLLLLHSVVLISVVLAVKKLVGGKV